MKRLLVLSALLAAAASAVQAAADPNALRVLDAAGVVAFEAETYNELVPAAVPGFGFVFSKEFDGYSRGGYMQSLPRATNIASDISKSPRLDYRVQFTQAGTIYLWGRVNAPTSNENSFHLGLNGQLLVDRIDVPTIGQWAWFAKTGASIQIPEPGAYTINCWLRESGCCIDKILLTADPKYVPAGYGPRDPWLGPALTMEPAADLVATGDLGKILSIQGINVSDLILGTTTFAKDPCYADQAPRMADNFDLNSNASADNMPSVVVMFDLPVTKIFLVEKGGDDSGFIQPLNAKGEALDDPIPFTAGSFGKVLKTDGTNLKVYGGQNGALAVITPETLIYGIRILPPASGALGIDLVSVSGVAGPVIKVKPITTLNAVASPTDPNTLLTVTAINGISASDLIVGTTEHTGTLTGNPGAYADDFDLTTYASCDNSPFVKTVFPIPVTTIFILERGANDSGFFQPIYAIGNPIGDKLAFAAADFQFDKTGKKIVNQRAGGLVIESKKPMSGLLILPPTGGVLGIDPASISAIPAPLINVAPVQSLVAVADPNTGKPLTIVSLDGIDARALVLGASIGDKPAAMDDFLLDNVYGGDIGGVIMTVFAQPVTTIFVLEKDGNDSGTLRPLDAQGHPIGGKLNFSPAVQSKWTFTVAGSWVVGGMVITSEVPIYGIEIGSADIDPMSISAIPVK
jgi:hypothetical protein